MLKEIVILLMVASSITMAQNGVFTLEDRERLIRVEEGLKSLQKQIDDLKLSTDKKIDDLKISTDRKIDDLKISTDKKIDDLKISTQRQFDELRSFLFWGFGIIFGGMGLLIGFVIWDRRSALQPVARRQLEMDRELVEINRRSKKTEQAIKEFAKQDPKMDDVIKSVGL